jgi:hypothetical protein
VVRVILRTRETNGTVRLAASISHPAHLELGEGIPEFEHVAGSVPFPTTFGEASDDTRVDGFAFNDPDFAVTHVENRERTATLEFGGHNFGEIDRPISLAACPIPARRDQD